MIDGVPTSWGGVVVAAGRSERYGASDKLLLDLSGRAVISWSIRAILSDRRIRQLALVGSTSNIDALRKIVRSEYSDCSIIVCQGGDTRSESVRNGIDALEPNISHVAIHDGARPLVTCLLVSRVLDAATNRGAAVPAVHPSSSIGVAGSDGKTLAGTLDRSRLREMQTPQAAARRFLNDALDRFSNETDESAALFRAGYEVALVDGESSNIKITMPSDFPVAAALLAHRAGCD
ncbi:MAG: IspD/TarI family cytidylyltransferase [Thermomicrobiales bacterium]